MQRVGLIDGARIGLALGACVVILAVVGLAPAFSWIPEVPFLVVAAVLPIAGFALAGSRAAAQTGNWTEGLIAGAVAGALSGAIGGLSYALFGKPLLNIAVGIALGSVGGAITGAAAGVSATRRPPSGAV
jgi:hypothetical protein